MIIKFKNADERKKHPQAGLIPDDVWDRYFKSEIDGKLLDIMTTKPEELLETINSISHNFSGNNAKEQILAAVVFSHPKFHWSSFKAILSSIYSEPTTISADMIAILAANNNCECLEHMLPIDNKMFFAIAFMCAAQTGHMDVLQYLENRAPTDLQYMITANDCAAFRFAAMNGHIEILRYLEGKISYSAFNKIVAHYLTPLFCYAAQNGHLEVLKYLENNAPHDLQNMIKANNYEAFRCAAHNGHIKILEYLEAKEQRMFHADPLQYMIMSNQYEAFYGAAENGHVAVLEHLAHQAPDDLIYMIKANHYGAFKCATQNGHIKVLQYLERIISDNLLREIIRSDCYDVFSIAAAGGHIEIFQYLETKTMRSLQDIIKQNDYQAFCLAARNGHVEVLKHLETKTSNNFLQNMIKANNYAAFQYAAECGHIETLRYLEEKIAPQKNLQDMIAADNYVVFQCAADGGHIEVLRYLEEKVVTKKNLQVMIQANNYAAFRYAAEGSHISVLEYMTKKAPNDVRAMIAANDYASWCHAANNGYANGLIFLMHYDFVRNQSFNLLTMYGLNYVFAKSSSSDIKELLKHPAIFEHACSHNQDEIKPFIAEQLQELKTRKVHGNPLHLLHNKQEAECLFYLLHHLIERVGCGAKDDILFLLSIPELQAILPTTRPPHNTTNLALRAAIIKKSGARRDDATWDEVIEKLYAIPAVCAQAERDGHYRVETRGQFELSAIANNTESSMQSLTKEESSQLAQLREHYRPQIYGVAGHAVSWMHVRNCFENYYHEHQAIFTNTKGEIITLPLAWDDFKKLKLSKEEYDVALKAYYTSPLHTAYRFFLRPNPWLANNASFVEVVDNKGGRAAKYGALKEDITVLTFAAFDKDIPPLASSGFNVEGRINIFCESIALIARGHNWDKTKEVGIDAKGNPIRAQYDDLEGDNPSCAQGMQKRLMQSLMAHPLFISIDAIAAEAVRDELHNIIKTKLAEFEYDALKNLYQSLYDVAESIGSQSTVELTFNNDCYATLVANILKKYHWVNREMLNNAIQQELQALGLVDKKHQKVLDKNLFLVGDLYIYTKNHICYIAEQKATPLILVTKYDEDEEDALETKELTDLDKIKRAISSAIDVCFKNQPLGEPLQSFITAANKAISIEELKSIWAKWTPSTAREHNFARDLEITYPDVFATKIIAEQMTYENLPDWYQELTQEEQAQRRQQNSPSAAAALHGLFASSQPSANTDANVGQGLGLGLQ